MEEIERAIERKLMHLERHEGHPGITVPNQRGFTRHYLRVVMPRRVEQAIRELKARDVTPRVSRAPSRPGPVRQEPEILPVPIPVHVSSGAKHFNTELIVVGAIGLALIALILARR